MWYYIYVKRERRIKYTLNGREHLVDREKYKKLYFSLDKYIKICYNYYSKKERGNKNEY